MPPSWIPVPFSIDVPEPLLVDLRERLLRARWPGEIPGSGWEYGTNLAYLRELVDYWRTAYDWRLHERELNRFRHYRALVDGIGLHFIHERGAGPNPLPLLLIHGWPGSVYEFSTVIPRLADPARFGGDPADSFDVIAPSLPGYGFSDPARERGFNIRRMGDLLARLMELLGYPRFLAQGGDWGAVIASYLGSAYLDRLLGIHLNMLGAGPHPEDRVNLSPAELAFLKEAEKFQRDGAGYQWIQGTRPQTLAYGLNDSPVGLAAWLVEKFRAWTDCDGEVERRLSKDRMLTLITIYWATQTIDSSMRLYYEERHHPWRLRKGERIRVPTGIAAFPREIFRPPREWAERVYNVVRWTALPSGGHFAAMEEPEALVAEIRTFARQLR
jgi:microsomal epoxide hydrolase